MYINICCSKDYRIAMGFDLGFNYNITCASSTRFTEIKFKSFPGFELSDRCTRQYTWTLAVSYLCKKYAITSQT